MFIMVFPGMAARILFPDEVAHTLLFLVYICSSMVFPGMAARILFPDEGARLYFSLYTFVHHGVPGHGGHDTLPR
jgi:hypothetical protein